MTENKPQLKCGTCSKELDEGGIGKLIGCQHCHRVFCSADCASVHCRELKVQLAHSLLEQAAALNLKAWEMLCEGEEIDDALEVALDLSASEAREQLGDDPGFKAYALLDYWELMAEEEADEATKIIRQRDQGRSQS